MAKILQLILVPLILLTLSSNVLAANWCDTAKACFLMENGSADENEATGTSDSVDGTTRGTSVDKKFGTYSVDMEYAYSDHLKQADGLPTDISGADQALSLTAWHKPENVTAITCIISKYDYGSGDRQYRLRLDSSSRLQFTLSHNGGDDTHETGTTAFSGGVWYHTAAVYDDSTMVVYVDGVQEGAPGTSFSSGISDKSSEFAVGVYFNSGSAVRPIDGLVDEVGVFDIALSATDVNEIMNFGLQPASGTSIYNATIYNATIYGE